MRVSILDLQPHKHAYPAVHAHVIHVMDACLDLRSLFLQVPGLMQRRRRRMRRRW
jgi:hypothetical protein